MAAARFEEQKAYCINLERDHELFEKQRLKFAELNINLIRSPGCITSEKDASSISSPNPIAYTSLSQLGCLKAHINAIREFHDSGSSTGLVVEDDVLLSPFFNSRLLDGLQLSAPRDWEVLQLGTSPKRITHHLLNCRVKYGLSWHRWHFGIWGCYAYLISRKAAEKILIATHAKGEFSLPMNWEPELNVADYLIYEYTNSYVSTYPFVGYLTTGIKGRISDNPEFASLRKANPMSTALSEDDFRKIWENTRLT